MLKLFEYKFVVVRLFAIICLLSLNNHIKAQATAELPLIENFEKDSNWIWSPWQNISNQFAYKTNINVHSGRFALNCQGQLFMRTDLLLGNEGDRISWWIKFEKKTNAYCGFGTNYENRYFFSVSAETQSIKFTDYNADGLHPISKVLNQELELNVWYRIEVLYISEKKVTGKLFASDGKTMLNSLTVEIPNLEKGGISFKGYQLFLDDIRGGKITSASNLDSSSTFNLGQSYTLRNITFEIGKSNLLRSSYDELDELVSILKKHPNYTISIFGHSDSSGTEITNQLLSKSRAEAVAKYLVIRNIDLTRIRFKGFGSSKPLVSNFSEEGRLKNRRVEIVIEAK